MDSAALRTNYPEKSKSLDVFDKQNLVVYFQQVISVSRKMVIGIEGLICGTDAQNGETAPAQKLLGDAVSESGLVDFDRHCRKLQLDQFSKIYCRGCEKLLFLSIDTSVIESSIGSGYLMKQVRQSGVSPSNVVIEISEKSCLSSTTLKKFADTYHQYGFMVALDDVGTGFSNMDRILLVRPDIIKVDHSLVKNIDSDFYKQGVFKSLVILANKIGALVIANGVETEAEAIHVLRLGGHMIEGCYFSVPEKADKNIEFFENGKINSLAKSFNEYMKLQYIQERSKHNQLYKIGRKSVERLSHVGCAQFDDELDNIVSDYPEIECAYILNCSGIQISHTVCPALTDGDRENLIFYSAKKGTDHSMEKYYYPLICGNRKRCTTEPYISMATGSLCITISYVFFSVERTKYILCIDLKTPEDSYNIEIRSPSVNPDGEKYQGLLSKMSEEIITDSLTGAYNRRYIEEALPNEVTNTSGSNQPLSVILGDIDMFKNVNDSFGHLAGDQVLKKFVSVTKSCIRKGQDWIARYGGDEFIIVLINANESAAKRVAETIRSRCENSSVNYEGTNIGFTVSLGILTSYSSQITAEELICGVDKKLYTAKETGRNQVVDSLFI